MAENNEEIKEVLEALEAINADEEKARIIELRQKYIMDKKAELRKAEKNGREKGLKDGLKQGKEETIVQVAKKMLEQEIAIEIIVKITGLNEEEIKLLKNKS